MAIGFLVGSSILTVYAGDQREMIQSFLETFIAVVVFLFTPRKLKGEIAKYIPGTNEYADSQHQYLKHLRELTVNKMEQFSKVFVKLSDSFLFTNQVVATSEGEQLEDFIQAVSDQSCLRCWKREQCWERDYENTYKSLSNMVERIRKGGELDGEEIPPEFRRKCVKQELVCKTMNQEYERWQNQLSLKNQIGESKRLVAAQLAGISRVIYDFAER